MHQFGMTQPEIYYLLQSTEVEDATVGLSKHMQCILEDLLHLTHFQIQGINQPCLTTRGTRPGDPIADILFNLCMCRILHDFKQRVVESTEVPWMGANTTVHDFTVVEAMPSEASWK